MARILVLEDDLEFGLELAGLLSEQGHDVDWRRSAIEARTAIETSRYDLLICDIYIYQDGKIVPDGGLALIGWVRTSALNPDYGWMLDLPIIAISGATRLPGNQNILDIAKTVGADYGLAKPFSDNTLLGTVADAVAPT